MNSTTKSINPAPIDEDTILIERRETIGAVDISSDVKGGRHPLAMAMEIVADYLRSSVEFAAHDAPPVNVEFTYANRKFTMYMESE
jgi:hypothetical protein